MGAYTSVPYAIKNLESNITDVREFCGKNVELMSNKAMVVAGNVVVPSAGYLVRQEDGSYTGMGYTEFEAKYTDVTVSVTGVTLNVSGDVNLGAGCELQLEATVAPADATDKSVSFASAHADIVTVTAKGLVTAVGAGSAAVTVTTHEGSETDTVTLIVT